MTPQEFIIWLKGFAAAANSYNVTPAQWDLLREQLNKVTGADQPIIEFGLTSTSTATTLPPGATVSFTTANSNKQLLND